MDKSVYNTNYSKLTYGRGYVYSLQYHIVWCTKYRKKVLSNGIDDDIKGYLNELAKEYSLKKTVVGRTSLESILLYCYCQ